MKVGILTFDDTSNYGAALQAYALNKKINELGFECETLRYRCESIAKREIPKGISDISGIKQLVYWCMTHKKKAEKLESIRSFLNNNALMSPDRYDKNTVVSANDRYDKFIVGSDIVWETNVIGRDFSYFLDFVNDKEKYSYAASFGYDVVPESDYDTCKEFLNSFSGISVREQKGVDIIGEMLPEKDVKLVCDPTLLLSRAEWETVSNAQIGLQPGEYIFLYFLDKDGILLNKAREIAKKENKKIVVYNDSLRKIKGAKNVFNIDVSAFLSYLKNSYMNLTASYHAVCFSIIFEKEFAIVNRAHSSRILSLLNTLGLSDRNLSTNPNCCDNKTDYDMAKDTLEHFRDYSVNYLKTILRG